MSLDKVFLENELRKKEAELLEVNAKVDELGILLEAARVNTDRINIEINLINDFINKINEAPEAPQSE